MNNFNLRKYLAENKLIKENITLDDALIKFENDESDSSAQPSIDGIQEIRKFIDFLRERNYNETELDKAFDEYTDEIRPPFNTHTDIQNFIDYYRKEKNKVELEENKLTEESPQDNPKIVHVSDKISDLRFKDKITSFMQLEPHLQDPLFRKALLKFLDFDASDKEFPGIRVDDLLSALEDNVIDGNIQL
tara:strand:- start:785 stop:1354 length:570 start_codon:yes stop_codon:yes gene_type:complete